MLYVNSVLKAYMMLLTCLMCSAIQHPTIFLSPEMYRNTCINKWTIITKLFLNIVGQKRNIYIILQNIDKPKTLTTV